MRTAWLRRKTSKSQLETYIITHTFISMGEDIGILEQADLVHSDGEDAMGQWFGELAAGREAQFFPGPPIAGRRRTGELSRFHLAMSLT